MKRDLGEVGLYLVPGVDVLGDAVGECRVDGVPLAGDQRRHALDQLVDLTSYVT